MLDAAGEQLGEREFEHGGAGLSQMADWLLSFAAGDAGEVGVAIETPSGPVVESLLEHGFAVHSIFLDQPLSDDPQARLLTQIQGAVAEYERIKVAERYRRGKLFRARQGEMF